MYEDPDQFVCQECAHDWKPGVPEVVDDKQEVRDAHGNVLQDVDTVTVIKDLKVKGSSSV